MLLLFVTLAACFPADPEYSVFEGTVRSSPSLDGPPLAGATLTSFAPDGSLFSETTAAENGTFALEIPWGGLFAVVTEADGHVPTSMTGFGVTDTVLAPRGAVFARTLEWWDAEVDRWQDCGDLTGAPPVVEGILRVSLPVPNSEIDTLPVVTTGELALNHDSDRVSLPCYLDDDGVFDPEAVATGDTGRFFFADVPTGWATLTSNHTADGVSYDGTVHDVFVPDSGVATLDPAFAKTPGL